jgi:hypothetical protein
MSKFCLEHYYYCYGLKIQFFGKYIYALMGSHPALTHPSKMTANFRPNFNHGHLCF